MGKKQYKCGDEMREKMRDFIKKFWINFHCGPSIRDIAWHFNKSTSLIHHHLVVGKQLGIFVFDEKTSRSIRLPEMEITWDDNGKKR